MPTTTSTRPSIPEHRSLDPGIEIKLGRGLDSVRGELPPAGAARLGRRVLMFYPSLLFPPDTGSRRRGMFVLEYLLNRFGSVHLCMAQAAPPAGGTDPAGVAELRSRGAVIHLVPLGGAAPAVVAGRLRRWASLLFRGRMPSFEGSGYLDPALNEGFRGVVAAVDPEVVLITHTRYAGLAASWPRGTFSVLDTIDVQKELDACYAGYSGLKALLKPVLQGYRERGAAYRSEVRILAKYRRILAISSGDRKAFLGAGLAEDSVFEVCEAFGETRSTPVALEGPKDIDLLVVASRFLGTEESIRYLLEQVLPRCRRPLSLTVVGSICAYLASAPVRPPDQVRMVQAGVVPDLAPYYQRSRLVVIPVLRGTGVSIKCAEAFSRGAAVVTTAIGARGTAAVDGENCLMAEGPESFAGKIEEALDDPALRGRLGAAALATSRRSRALAYETLDRLFAPVLA